MILFKYIVNFGIRVFLPYATKAIKRDAMDAGKNDVLQPFSDQRKIRTWLTKR